MKPRGRMFRRSRANFILFLLALNLNAQDTGEKEAAMGAQLAARMQKRTTPIESTAVRGYVDAIGNQLAGHLPNAGFPYKFHVVADGLGAPTHEPLALPAGHIFIPAALIATAPNETEFAHALAHAMAHLALRHGYRQGPHGELVVIGASASNMLPKSLRATQRQFEAEADLLATHVTRAAGYDRESTSRFNAIQNEIRQALSQLTVHPPPSLQPAIRTPAPAN